MLALRYKDRTFVVPQKEATIGRSSISDFQISHYMVSRKHCTVTATPEGVRVSDLQSSNGTFINGSPVHPAACTAQAGDIIQLGTMELEVTDTSAPSARPEQVDPGHNPAQDELPTMVARPPPEPGN